MTPSPSSPPPLPLSFVAHQSDCAAAVLPLHAPRHVWLIVPHARVEQDNPSTVEPPSLPQLQRLVGLLNRLGASQWLDEGESPQRITPHERAAARAWGLSPDAPAWAAHAAELTGEASPPQAWFTPCHWSVGADQIRMMDPRALALTPAEVDALHRALAPWFADDGLTLNRPEPDSAGLLWRVYGQALAHMQTASLEAVIGRDVRHWQPRPKSTFELVGLKSETDAQATLGAIQRLHSEVQMLLYNHPLNAEREAARQLPINAFWLHGAGTLEKQAIELTAHFDPACPPYVHVVDALRQAALLGRWQDWTQAWCMADEGVFAHWVAHLQPWIAAGGRFSLVLCGPQRALGLSLQNSANAPHAPGRWWQFWRNRWVKTSTHDLPAIWAKL